MKEEDKIIEKFGREGGWKVPEGYFDSLPERIVASLPEREVPEEPRVTRWQRFKPYLYLAAMFAGIWLMMNVFHRVAGVGEMSLDNPPENIAMILDHPDAEYFTTDLGGVAEVMSDMEMEYAVSEEYTDFSEFEKDFGYTLRPEYRDMEI